MSQFKSKPRAVTLSTVAVSPKTGSFTHGYAPSPPPPAAAISSMPSDALPTNMVASIGFVLYCTYLLSGFANDWAMRLLGNKAYISTVTLLLLPVAWLLSGSALRGLQRPIGRWWAVFLVWLLLATPFSVWRGGSAAMLWNYIPRSYLSFFYICAFVTSVRRCRYLMYVNVAGAVIVLLTCLKFGDTGAGDNENRFMIPGSLFYSNANDLALSLLLAITSFIFLFYLPGMKRRILGAAGILLCTMYALKTGSRGCMLASLAMFVMIFFFSRNKIGIIIFALPIIGLAVLMLPSSTMRRLLLFGFNPETIQAQSGSDDAAIASQLERQLMFKQSLYYTVTHPLLGVGPDEFAVAAAGDAAKTGIRAAWLGTHNSYTQISSECGIPAFICYCAVLVICFRSNWQLFRQSRDNPALQDVTGLSFCLLLATLVYSVSTFFFHIAYGGALPELAGFTLALRLAAEPLLTPKPQPALSWQAR